MTTASKVPVLVIGASTMDAAIAQIAAQASHRVFRFDLRTGAANGAKAKLAQTFDALVGNGKPESNAARDTLARFAA